jgi:hypothetical protein
MSQPVLVSIYRYWTWIGVPVMVIALAALVLLIPGLMATVKKAYLFKVPLSERQEVQFTEAGRVMLSTEAPYFSRRFAGVNFELKGIDGDPVASRWVLFRMRTSGMSAVRVEVLKYDIPRPGRYVLTMTGLGAARESDAWHAVVFMRPHLKQVVTYILGILLASSIFVSSLVFFLLSLRETGPGA